MRISYYELLGLIKENSQPEKVVYNDVVFSYENKCYVTKAGRGLPRYMAEFEMFERNIIVLEMSEIIEEDKKIEFYDYIDNYEVMDRTTIAYNFQHLNEDMKLISEVVNKLKKESK